ncbi:hypothetical protein [Qipengyuania sp.]|uniref:hypothetical protein n=1 Tax=Qipengyuania sp. TaxID=2004515 RepID=UPI0035C7DA92
MAVAFAPLLACSAPSETTTPLSPSSLMRQETERRVADFVEAENPGMGKLMLLTGRTDLDSDGVDEVLAYIAGPMRCGTGGCNLLVLKDDGTRFTKIGEVSVTQLPVGVLSTTTDGMRDLWVTVYGGGRAQATMRVPFVKGAYAGNPTVAPATPIEERGESVIGDDLLTVMD